jgi:imidazolonepropionase-like amidohydrolase
LLGVAAGILTIAYRSTLYPGQGAPPGDIVIRGGMLFDGTGTTPVDNPGIVVRNGTIACVGSACDIPDTATQVDADGLAILPGLIDLHGHFFGRRDDPGVAKLIWDAIRLRPDYRRQLIESGITSFRSVGDPRDAIFEVKRRLNARELGGPRMFVAGPIFTAPGGHPAYGGRDPNPGGFGGNMAFQSDDPRQVREEVDRLAAQGADGIKAVFHGNVAVGQPSLPTLSLRTLEALADAARVHGLWMAVHVGPLHETGQAVQAGATTIEHGVRQGNLIDDSTLQTLISHHVVYVPTLGREPQGHLNIPALVASDVMIGVGTDGEDYHEELARLEDAGMPASEVLLAATINGAKALLRDQELGSIEAGKVADIVITQGEPWKNVRDLKAIVTVIQGGHLVFSRR